MSSPKLETIFIFNQSTGVPLSGQSSLMFFDCYRDDLGNSITPPTITEIGSAGVYKFTPVFADPARGIVYILNCGTGANPQRVTRYMRPEDWNSDNTDVLSSTLATSSTATGLSSAIASIQTDTTLLLDCELGDESVVASGSDANRFIKYKQDGTTIIKKYNLTDANNVPTVTDPFNRKGV
jgi:hypothetical protein